MVERQHYYYLAPRNSERMMGVFERSKLVSILGVSESPETTPSFSQALDEGRLFTIGKFLVIGKSEGVFAEWRKFLSGEREDFPTSLGNTYEDRAVVPEDKKRS